MAEKLDTSWFDLNKYDTLKTLDLRGWERQLTTRRWIKIKEGYGCELIAEQIKTRPIINHQTPRSEYKAWKQRGADKRDKAYRPIFAQFEEDPKPWWHDPNVRPFNTYSVMNTAELYAWHHKDSDKQNLVTMDLAATDGFNGLSDRLANITIDLTATDEQLKSDFSRWLTEYRKTIDYESYKTKGYKFYKKKGIELYQTKFTDKDLSYWVECRLLPYIDLTLVAAVEKKTITQAEIGRLVYPYTEHHSEDITQKIRKTVIPKADWLFRDETLQAIRAQIWATA